MTYKTLLLFTLTTAIGMAFLYIASYGLKKAEQAECLKFQAWLEQPTMMQVSPLMIDQCSRYGIELRK